MYITESIYFPLLLLLGGFMTILKVIFTTSGTKAPNFRGGIGFRGLYYALCLQLCLIFQKLETNIY